MPHNVRSNIETGVQVVIAIAIVAIAAVVVKRHLDSREITPASAPRVTIGERLNVSNVDWEANKKSLVFFLMKDCIHLKHV